MKIRILCLVLLTLLMVTGLDSCSKKDFDPDDYVTSMLSGEYSKGGIWRLHVSVNGQAQEDFGYVRFETKTLNEGDFLFSNVIPGDTHKEFHNVVLSATEQGYAFIIEYSQTSGSVMIKGTVAVGDMSIDIII